MWTRLTASMLLSLLCLALGCAKQPEPAPTVEPAPPAAQPGEKGAAEQAATEAVKPPAPPAQPQVNLQADIRAAARKGDFAAALELAEKAVAAEPENAEGIFVLAQICQGYGNQLSKTDRAKANALLIRSADSMRQLRDRGGELTPDQKTFLPRALYNAACAYSMDGNKDESLACLREAFDAGFTDIHLAETDADLEQMRDVPELKSLLAETRKKIMEQLRAETREELAAHEPFAFSFKLPDTQGKEISLADYQGKVVIVDIWGTWCPPCRMEIPHFVALLDKYRKSGLEMVGINYERSAESTWNETIDKFVAENGISYPCVIGNDETRDQVPEFRGYPTTLFIDRSGTVRLKVVGYHPYEKLESIVLELLAGDAERT